MSDWFLLYLFTRLDVLKDFFGFWSILGGFGFGVAAGAGFLEDIRALRVVGAIGLASVLMSTFLSLALPSQKDVAIIVGGSVAIDAARSDEAKELASDVMAAIRAKLKEAAQ